MCKAYSQSCILRHYSRRDILALSAGLAASIVIAPAAYAQSMQPAPAAARTRAIPRSGERLSVIGLGTAIIFDIGGDTEKRAERTKVIHTLLDGGARMIDTAPSYGTAESVVGDLLASMKVRDKVLLATKVRANSNDTLIAQMKESQMRLHSEKIDLMQLHNVGFLDRAPARERSRQRRAARHR